MIKRLIASVVALALLIAPAIAQQSSPGFITGQVPTAAQWNSYFATKLDYNLAGLPISLGGTGSTSASGALSNLGALPLIGGTMTGKLIVAPSAATNGAGLNLPPGATPSSPNNGDMWTTSAGLFVQINGSTVGPVGTGGGGSGCTVSGGAQYQLLVNNGSSGCSNSPNATVNLGALTLGASGTLGTVTLGNATSGTIKLTPPTGALGSAVLTLPDATDQLVGRATTDTLTNKTYSGGVLGGTFTGSPTLSGNPVLSGTPNITGTLQVGGNAMTFPGSAKTLAANDFSNVVLSGSCTNSGLVLTCSGGGGGYGSNVQGGTTYTVQASDNGKIISTTNSAAVTVTVPTGLGAIQFGVQQGGSGQVTVSPAGGVLLLAYGSPPLTTFGQNAPPLVFSQNGTTNNFTASVPSANVPNPASLSTTDQTVTGGANDTPYNLGTINSGTTTLDCGLMRSQYLTDNGAFTLAAPSNDGMCVIKVTNSAAAGVITFSGFTVGSNTGDAINTTNGDKFFISILRINGTSTYVIKALQ